MTIHMDDHGEMQFDGFDTERFVLFRCVECGRRLAMHPRLGTVKFLAEGEFYAVHRAVISQRLFPPDVYKTLWDMDVKPMNFDLHLSIGVVTG